MKSWLPVRTCLGLVEHLLKVPHAKREDSFKLKSTLASLTSSVAGCPCSSVQTLQASCTSWEVE